jgi:hypothetical protein
MEAKRGRLIRERRTRQQKHPASQFGVQLRLRVVLQQQAGLQKLGIFECEVFPTPAVAAFTDMLLNQRKIRDRYRFVVSMRLAEMPCMVADRAAQARQSRGEASRLKIKVSRTDVGAVPEVAFRQRATFQGSKEFRIGHGFSLRR